MTRRSWLPLLLALAGCNDEARQPADPSGKPELALLTSLPIAFPEQFALDGPPHPLLQRLQRDYLVRPVDGPEQLPPGGLLLAVQPRALTAERLVALDAWVRAGGRLVLLADPSLKWESSKPLGDVSRPPFSYPDTGLLAHWGLRLEGSGEDGPATRRLGGREVATSAPGVLVKTGGDCVVEEAGLVARCALGKGRAIVIADADLVQEGVGGGSDAPTAGNHDAVAATVASLR